MTADDPSPLILAFGDSLTAGYGLARTEAFPAQLEGLLRREHGRASVHNGGVSGDTTGSGLARLPRLLSGLRRRPDLAIVELGANDLLRGVDPAVARANLDAILDLLDGCAIPVLLAGMIAPPLFGPVATRFNAIHPELAARRGLPLYPFFLAGAIGAGMTIGDGLHPNARAIAIVAGRILPHVLAALPRVAAPAGS